MSESLARVQERFAQVEDLLDPQSLRTPRSASNPDIRRKIDNAVPDTLEMRSQLGALDSIESGLERIEEYLDSNEAPKEEDALRFNIEEIADTEYEITLILETLRKQSKSPAREIARAEGLLLQAERMRKERVEQLETLTGERQKRVTSIDDVRARRAAEAAAEAVKKKNMRWPKKWEEAGQDKDDVLPIEEKLATDELEETLKNLRENPAQWESAVEAVKAGLSALASNREMRGELKQVARALITLNNRVRSSPEKLPEWLADATKALDEKKTLMDLSSENPLSQLKALEGAVRLRYALIEIAREANDVIIPRPIKSTRSAGTAALQITATAGLLGFAGLEFTLGAGGIANNLSELIEALLRLPGLNAIPPYANMVPEYFNIRPVKFWNDAARFSAYGASGVATWMIITRRVTGEYVKRVIKKSGRQWSPDEIAKLYRKTKITAYAAMGIAVTAGFATITERINEAELGRIMAENVTKEHGKNAGAVKGLDTQLSRIRSRAIEGVQSIAVKQAESGFGPKTMAILAAFGLIDKEIIIRDKDGKEIKRLVPREEYAKFLAEADERKRTGKGKTGSKEYDDMWKSYAAALAEVAKEKRFAALGLAGKTAAHTVPQNVKINSAGSLDILEDLFKRLDAGKGPKLFDELLQMGAEAMKADMLDHLIQEALGPLGHHMSVKLMADKEDQMIEAFELLGKMYAGIQTKNGADAWAQESAKRERRPVQSLASHELNMEFLSAVHKKYIEILQKAKQKTDGMDFVSAIGSAVVFDKLDFSTDSLSEAKRRTEVKGARTAINILFDLKNLRDNPEGWKMLGTSLRKGADRDPRLAWLKQVDMEQLLHKVGFIGAIALIYGFFMAKLPGKIPSLVNGLKNMRFERQMREKYRRIDVVERKIANAIALQMHGFTFMCRGVAANAGVNSQLPMHLTEAHVRRRLKEIASSELSSLHNENEEQSRMRAWWNWLVNPEEPNDLITLSEKTLGFMAMPDDVKVFNEYLEWLDDVAKNIASHDSLSAPTRLTELTDEVYPGFSESIENLRRIREKVLFGDGYTRAVDEIENFHRENKLREFDSFIPELITNERVLRSAIEYLEEKAPKNMPKEIELSGRASFSYSQEQIAYFHILEQLYSELNDCTESLREIERLGGVISDEYVKAIPQRFPLKQRVFKRGDDQFDGIAAAADSLVTRMRERVEEYETQITGKRESAASTASAFNRFLKALDTEFEAMPRFINWDDDKYPVLLRGNMYKLTHGVSSVSGFPTVRLVAERVVNGTRTRLASVDFTRFPVPDLGGTPNPESAIAEINEWLPPNGSATQSLETLIMKHDLEADMQKTNRLLREKFKNGESDLRDIAGDDIRAINRMVAGLALHDTYGALFAAAQAGNADESPALSEFTNGYWAWKSGSIEGFAHVFESLSAIELPKDTHLVYRVEADGRGKLLLRRGRSSVEIDVAGKSVDEVRNDVATRAQSMKEASLYHRYRLKALPKIPTRRSRN